MIIIGGLTRLTDSGLSITEWELFKGVLPPLTQDTWDKYFSLYKKIPQYQLMNLDMTLNDFKVIFYWEYFHRILGRIIGLFFLIPFVFFWFSKKIKKNYLIKCGVILLLIILQGFIGWYMVQSGLTNKTTVSHYRLSIHLALAFVIISIIYWNILNVKKNSFKDFFKNKDKNYIFYIFILLILIQIILGAFVSGLDAGRIYQTWPLMNYTYFPDDVEINKLIDLINFDNHALVQFYHRNIAYLILGYSFFVGIFIFKNNLSNLKNSFYFVLIFLIFQVLLGIMTLISGLNIYIASGHQIFSLLLILSVINLYYHYIN
jgi:cytochrome c oxidase assembly protein subunit 15